MDIDALYQIICDRRDQPSEQSYTASLLQQGEDRILQKIGEESVEIILAAKGQGNPRLVEEVADLTYHVLVMLAYYRLTPADIRTELERRHRPAS